MQKKENYSQYTAKLTEFNDNLFRSRLEAKWAVFFVASEIDYFHELEAYTLSNGRGYLPDFYLPTLNLFAEVKPRVKEEFDKVLSDLENLYLKGKSTREYPEKPSTKLETELLKLKLLFEETGTPIVLLDNIPKQKPYLVYDGEWNMGYWGNSNGEITNFKIELFKFGFSNLQKKLNTEKIKGSSLTNSIRIANTSQFEFGSTPTEESIKELKLDMSVDTEIEIHDKLSGKTSEYTVASGTYEQDDEWFKAAQYDYYKDYYPEFNKELYQTKLDVKWAVFFNLLNKDYLYRADSYQNANGDFYRPPFYLVEPSQQTVVYDASKKDFDTFIAELTEVSNKGESTNVVPLKSNNAFNAVLLDIIKLHANMCCPIILLDGEPKNKPYLIYDSQWYLGIWIHDDRFNQIFLKYYPLSYGYDVLLSEMVNQKYFNPALDTALSITKKINPKGLDTPSLKDVLEDYKNNLETYVLPKDKKSFTLEQYTFFEDSLTYIYNAKIGIQ